ELTARVVVGEGGVSQGRADAPFLLSGFVEPDPDGGGPHQGAVAGRTPAAPQPGLKARTLLDGAGALDREDLAGEVAGVEGMRQPLPVALEGVMAVVATEGTEALRQADRHVGVGGDLPRLDAVGTPAQQPGLGTVTEVGKAGGGEGLELGGRPHGVAHGQPEEGTAGPVEREE